MENEVEVRKAIEDVFQALFPDADMVDANIREDVDHDGDPVLWIDVIFDAASDALDANIAVGFVRHLLPKFEDIGVEAFPIMTFISCNDHVVAA